MKKTGRILFFIPVLLIILFSAGCGDNHKNRKDEPIRRFKSFGKFGFTGVVNGQKFFIDPHFDYARDFHQGLAVVESENKFGYIGTNGEYAIQPIYEAAYDYSENLARVKNDGKFGFIDLNGTVVLGFIYDDASDFIHGFAYVKIGKQKFTIDEAGRVIEKTNDLIFRPKTIY